MWSNQEQLVQFIEECWEKVSISPINSYIDDLCDKIELVVNKNHGILLDKNFLEENYDLTLMNFIYISQNSTIL